MRNRKGIILLMFDLPSLTSEDRREYNHFRKDLRKQGFLQLQESCYLKLVRNMDTVEQVMMNLKMILPADGMVSALPMNLSDFRGMRSLLGEPFDMALFTDDVYCIGEEENESA